LLATTHELMECRRLIPLSCPVTAPLLASAPPLEAPDTPPRHPAAPHSPTIPSSPLGQDTAEPSKQLLSISPPTLPSPSVSSKPSCPLLPLPPDSDQARLVQYPPEPLPPIPVTHLLHSPSRAQVRLLLAPLITVRAIPSSPNDPSPSAPDPSLPDSIGKRPRSTSRRFENSFTAILLRVFVTHNSDQSTLATYSLRADKGILTSRLHIGRGIKLGFLLANSHTVILSICQEKMCKRAIKGHLVVKSVLHIQCASAYRHTHSSYHKTCIFAS
jgi:hypothetical protein